MQIRPELHTGHEPGYAYMPATAPDGEWACVSLCFTPTPEQEWMAYHPDRMVRATYLIDVIGRALTVAREQEGYTAGWEYVE